MTKLKKKTKILKLKIKKTATTKKPTKRKVGRPKKIVVVNKPKTKPKKKIVEQKKSTIKPAQNPKRQISFDKIKSGLLEEKMKIEAELSKPQVTFENVDVDGDETDEIQAKILVQMSAQLKIRNQEKLQKIENALRRIEMESYGDCDDCGEPIPEKRLEANPHVLVCVGCAELREIEKKGSP